MAEQTGLYRYSGKMFNTVGARWRKNRDVVKFWKGAKKGRTLPLSMKKQIARMTALGELSCILYPAYMLGMGKFAKRRQMSENNLFVKENMPAVSADSSLAVSIDFAKIKLSKGHLPMVLFSQADFSTPQTVKISFGSAAGVEGASEEDKVYAAVYCPTSGGLVLSRPVTRDSDGIRVTLPDDWNGLEVKVWGWAIGDQPNDRNDGEASDCTFLGSGTVN